MEERNFTEKLCYVAQAISMNRQSASWLLEERGARLCNIDLFCTLGVSLALWS